MIQGIQGVRRVMDNRKQNRTKAESRHKWKEGRKGMSTERERERTKTREKERWKQNYGNIKFKYHPFVQLAKLLMGTT